MGTQFTYQSISYDLSTCSEYPFSQAFIDNNIASQFQDGYVTSRPRISMNLSTYSLVYVAAVKRDKLVMQDLESKVRSSEIFTWTPDFPIDKTDYSNYPELDFDTFDFDTLISDPQPRQVRLVSPILFELQAFDLYTFNVNLQEAI